MSNACRHGKASLPATLEILVPTTFDRAGYFAEFRDCILPQIESEPRVSIRPLIDQGEHNGGMPIGMKRNILLDQAQSDYVCFWDDDDLVAVDAVKQVIDAIDRGQFMIRDGVDVIGIHGLKINDDGLTNRIVQSLQYKVRVFRDGTWYSYPTHLNPVKLSIAKRIRFPLISFGEDAEYSRKLLPELKSEVVIAQPIYHYFYRRVKEERHANH